MYVLIYEDGRLEQVTVLPKWTLKSIQGGVLDAIRFDHEFGCFEVLTADDKWQKL